MDDNKQCIRCDMQGSRNGLISRTIMACFIVPEGINGIQEEHKHTQDFQTKFK